MTAFIFYSHIVDAHRNRALMARLLLNALGMSRRFPVDISELKQLTLVNRAAYNAFRSEREVSFAKPTLKCRDRMKLLKAIAKGTDTLSTTTLWAPSPVDEDTCHGNVVPFTSK
jgi:hypothetical protein